MDKSNGKIYSENELKEQSQEIQKRSTMLSPEEYKAMHGIPEQNRPMELALLRFIKKREQLGVTADSRLQNAFQLGYLAALKDRGIEHGR